jgi:hypothetical protein
MMAQPYAGCTMNLVDLSLFLPHWGLRSGVECVVVYEEDVKLVVSLGMIQGSHSGAGSEMVVGSVFVPFFILSSKCGVGMLQVTFGMTVGVVLCSRQITGRLWQLKAHGSSKGFQSTPGQEGRSLEGEAKPSSV